MSNPDQARPRQFSRRAVLGYAAAVPTTLGLASMLHSTEYLDTLGGSARGARLDRILRSPNFRDGIFQNPVETTVMAPGKNLDAAKDWFFSRAQRVPPNPLPSAAVTRDTFAVASTGLTATWMGHSTVLLEIEGRRLLFDPVWSRRSSPSSLVGPARFQPVPLALEDLPELTAVAISHDHYDHLDKATIQFLARRDPRLPFLVPLGVGAHLESWGVEPQRIVELDWWEEAKLSEDLRLVAAPARHFSGRGVFDRNRTLWTSWVALGRTHRAYFGGDGGYYPGFADLGERFGPFDLTMLEIGAYHENWGLIHLGPENALRAHVDLKGRRLLPIHWGAFNLAVHAWDEPITTLVERAPAMGVELVVPRLGERVAIEQPSPVTAWWSAAR